MLADGDLKGAQARYADCVDEAKKLTQADPGDMAHRELLSTLLHLNGSACAQLGQNSRADELFSASFQISRQLVDHDPTNATWRRGLVQSHQTAGQLLVRAQRPNDALEYFTTALAMSEKLGSIEPDNLEFLSDLASAHQGMASATASGYSEEAQRHIQQALMASRRFHELGGHSLESIKSLALTLVLAGEIHQTAGQPEAATASWQEAYQLLQPVAETSRTATTQFVWLRILTHLDQIDQARTVATKLWASGFARRDFLVFCEKHELRAQTGIAGH